MPFTPEIAILLPYAERFGPDGAGAAALVARDTSLESRYRERIRVYGRAVEQAFEGVGFEPLRPAWPTLLGRNVGLAERLVRRLPGRGPLVEVHNRPNMLLWLAARRRRLALALRLGNDPQGMAHARGPAARARLLRRAAAIYCVSEYVRDRFLEGLSDAAGKVHVVHHGIARALTRPPAKENVILFVGRIYEGKGVGHLLDALERVLPRHPSWRAELVGARRFDAAAPPDAYEARARARCQALGGATWRGFLPNDEVLEHFRRAAVAVVPSLVEEALGRTAIEALAAGCAVVAYASGGLPEVVRGRGLLLEDRTAPSLAAALDRVLSDDALRADLQRRAWEDYPFTLAEAAARYDRVREGIFERLERER